MAAFPDIIDSVGGVPAINPLEEGTEFSTLINKFDNGTESRKQKRLYPRRNFGLKYTIRNSTHLKTLYDFYLARKGSFEAFNFFHPFIRIYAGEYVGTGDGSTLLYNLPFKLGTDMAIYVDGLLQIEVTNYTITASGGADGADLLTMVAAVADGSQITCDFTARLKVHCRFKDDALDMTQFAALICYANTGLGLVGLLNE